MRIGTWNLQQRWSPAHEELLERQSCDVWLLTEVHAGTAVPGLPVVSRSAAVQGVPPRAAPPTWSAVLARDGAALPSPHPASALLEASGWTFCSSVLPWRGSGSLDGHWEGTGHGPRTQFALDCLLPALRGRRAVWGGDWNQPLQGQDSSGSAQARAALESACASLGLHVPTRSLPHRLPELFSIDHIALPAPVRAAQHVAAEAGGRRLSDHDAYVVEVDLPERDPGAP